jgi:glycosyltransferase involved in cell wall biosynthesis
MKLRVIQLGPVPPPEGGVSRNLFAIRERLLSEGSECKVVATTKSEAAAGGEGIYFSRTPFELIRVLRGLDADITHLHLGGEITPRVLSLALAVTVFGRGKKVLTMHSGGFPSSQAGRAASPATIASVIFRRFDHVIAVNEDIADVFRRYGIEDEDLSVIPPFNLSRPPAGLELPAEITDFTDRHSPLLVSVGGLEPEYQPILLIESLKKLKADHPDAGLIIVGGGSIRRETAEAVSDAGLDDDVMLAGAAEHDVVLKLIEEADATLRITKFDGDAISVRESLFLGTPVIATSAGIRPAGVHLIDEQTPESVVEAINKVLSDAGKAAAVFDSDDHIGEVVELYSKLLADRSDTRQ